MAEQSVGLDAFIEAAGSGLSSAQEQLAGAELQTTAMAVSEAKLEARVLLEMSERGAVRVVSVGREDLQALGAGADALSTVTVNFVALTSTDAEPGATTPPVKRETAISNLAERDDVVRLAQVLGPLAFEATFVPSRAAWLVTASDGRGRRVREVVVDKES